MTSRFASEGGVIRFTTPENVALSQGDVWLCGNVLGVALEIINGGKTGAFATEGVFEVYKINGAEIKQGEKLVAVAASLYLFDDKSAVPAEGDVTGGSVVAWEDAAPGTDKVKVRFCGVPGTITPAPGP